MVNTVVSPGPNVRVPHSKWHIVHAPAEKGQIENFLHHCRQHLDLRRTILTCPGNDKDLNCIRHLSKPELQQRTTLSGTHLGRNHLFQLHTETFPDVISQKDSIFLARQCLDERLKPKLAGHTIEPDTFLHEGVLALITSCWTGNYPRQSPSHRKRP